jgi:hypothetical protein
MKSTFYGHGRGARKKARTGRAFEVSSKPLAKLVVVVAVGTRSNHAFLEPQSSK